MITLGEPWPLDTKPLPPDDPWILMKARADAHRDARFVIYETYAAQTWSQYAADLRRNSEWLEAGRSIKEAEDADAFAQTYWRRAAEELLAWLFDEVPMYMRAGV